MTGTEGMQLLQSFSNAVTELADIVSPSVVSVNAGRRSGTGIVWSSGGLVVTAHHVVGRSGSPVTVMVDGRELAAKVVGSDPFTDVALLKVEAEGLVPVNQGSAEGVRVGQFVLALANATGRKASATSGIVTSHRRSMR
ncbi:MAG TPA: trypsin-like peptidase domain-containing protein, partial [Nitrososphaerales archaeon]|nr:trypsin-like peptidase domain-containing protein [Nitrososphaerales archaeon]